MRKRYQAFTFLELTIVTSIMIIFIAMTFITYQNSKANAKLEAAQTEVISAIKLAQNYALQGKIQSGEVVCGYGFRFVDDTANYEIFYNKLVAVSFDNCGEQNADSDYREYNTSFSSVAAGGSFNLPEGVSLTSSTPVFFDIPSANTYNANTGGNLGSGGITISIQNSSGTADIHVYDKGRIEGE